MTHRINFTAKVVWVALALIVLLSTLYYFDGTPNSDADILLAIGMLTLSFPVSWVLVGIAAIVGEFASHKFGLVFAVSYLSIVVRWGCLFVVGYWQWFWAVPWIVRHFWKKEEGDGEKGS